MDGIIYLTLDQAKAIHAKTIQYSGGGTTEPLDTGKLDCYGSGKQQSLWRNHCHDCRHPHVCRYFWHNSRCGSTSFQGRSAGYGSVLYDGGYNPVAAFPDYASQGCKTQTAVAVHRNLCGWNYFSGLFI